MLNADEEIVIDRNPHWSFMLNPITMIVMSVLVFIALTIFIPAIWWAGLIVIGLALIGSLGRFLRWKTTEFVVTTDRIIVRVGIIAKRGIEIPLDRIMNIAYTQSVFERILGTGDLVIESAGENGRQAIPDVSDPSNVQNIIYRQAEIYQGRGTAGDDGMGADTAGHHRMMSIPEQIEKLDELRQRGVVSDAEFEAKKQKLLDKL